MPNVHVIEQLRAFFWKIGRISCEEMILQLIMSKCIPVLLYDREVCALNIFEIASLDSVINRFSVKLFQTNNIEIVSLTGVLLLLLYLR